MEKDKTSLERTILLATSVVGGIGGLFAAINGLSDSFVGSAPSRSSDQAANLSERLTLLIGLARLTPVECCRERGARCL
jgi:hypothetical protein